MPDIKTNEWIDQIERARKLNTYQRWKRRAKTILRRYTLDSSGSRFINDDSRVSEPQFNILWANTETLLPALYARAPKIQVERRFHDANRVAGYAASLMERALNFAIDDYDFNATMRNVLKDYALLGRGVARVRYIPTFEGSYKVEDEEASEDQEEYQEEGAEKEAEGEELVYEQAVCEYVHWADFITSDARTWDEVDWVAFRSFLSKDELKDRFGEAANDILEGREDKMRESSLSNRDLDDVDFLPADKFIVWEVWDKSEKQVLWVSPEKTEPLEVSEPPLNLNGFFPCPRPLLGTTTTSGIIPTPDFSQYEEQARELDAITARVSSLIPTIRVAGAYNASFKELQDILTQPNNRLLPINNWAALANSNGLRGNTDFLPLDQQVSAITSLSQALQGTKGAIYELTGISDLLRGDNDPRATATAEQIKGNYGSLRLRERQEEVARFVRDIVRLKGEIIAESFEVDSYQRIAGVQLPTPSDKSAAEFYTSQGQQLPPQAQVYFAQPTWEEVVAFLKNDRVRSLNVDIETDSTVALDRQQELQELTAFATQISQILQQAAQAVETAPELAVIGLRIVKNMLTRYKLPRALETEVEVVIERLQQRLLAPPPQQPGQDPQALALAQQQQQQDAQLRQAEVQAQFARANAQHLSAQAAARRAEAEIIKANSDIQIAQIDAQIRLREAQYKERQLDVKIYDLQTQQQNQQIEAYKSQLDLQQPPPPPPAPESVTTSNTYIFNQEDENNT